MVTSQSRQTIAPDGHRVLRLPGFIASKGVISPYFQRQDTREEAPGRDIPIYTSMIKAFFTGWAELVTGMQATIETIDDSGPNTYTLTVDLGATTSSTTDGLVASVETVLNDYCDNNSIPRPDSFERTFVIPSEITP